MSWRASRTKWRLKHTAPYRQNRSAPSREEQAFAAVKMHMETTEQATQPKFLDSLADFQFHQHRARIPGALIADEDIAPIVAYMKKAL